MSSDSSPDKKFSDTGISQVDCDVENSDKESFDISLSSQRLEDIKAIMRKNIASLRSLNALIFALLIVILSFHPWITYVVDKATIIIPLLLLVVVFIYVVNPIVHWFMRRVHRIAGRNIFNYRQSLLITYLILLLFFVVFSIIVFPIVNYELRDLAHRIPNMIANLPNKFSEYRQDLYEILPVQFQGEVDRYIGEMSIWLRKFVTKIFQYVTMLSSLLAWFTGAIIFVPLISYYILADGEHIRDYLASFLSEKYRKRSLTFISCFDVTMQRFLRGQIILCILMGIITTIVVAPVLPEYCIILGIVAGITEAIPVIGPILGTAPAALLALVVPDGGIGSALFIVVIYTVIQRLENAILVPRVMGDSLGIHPLSVILGMIVFGNMFGFWGMLFSPSIVAIIKIAIHVFGRGETNPCGLLSVKSSDKNIDSTAS